MRMRIIGGDISNEAAGNGSGRCAIAPGPETFGTTPESYFPVVFLEPDLIPFVARPAHLAVVLEWRRASVSPLARQCVGDHQDFVGFARELASQRR